MILKLFLILIMSRYFLKFCCNPSSFQLYLRELFSCTLNTSGLFLPLKMWDILIEKMVSHVCLICFFLCYLWDWAFFPTCLLTIYFSSIVSLLLLFSVEWSTILKNYYWYFGRFCVSGINSCFVISATDNFSSLLFVFYFVMC